MLTLMLSQITNVNEMCTKHKRLESGAFTLMLTVNRPLLVGKRGREVFLDVDV